MAHLQWVAAVSLVRSHNDRSGEPPRMWVVLLILIPILLPAILIVVMGDI